MTETDPRPALAYAEDMNAAPPPEDRRACADHHRAGGGGTPADAPGEPGAERPDAGAGHDGGEDEFHHGGKVWKGSIAARDHDTS